MVLPPKDDIATELRDQLEWTRRALSVKDAEMRAILGQRDTSIAELESVRRRLITREHAAKDFESALAARDARIRELEQQLEAARLGAGNATDDLKRIKGIGPAFERELRRLGITTFAQIAVWTAEEVETISRKIKAKPERIRRDAWVGRATELMAERGGL